LLKLVLDNPDLKLLRKGVPDLEFPSAPQCPKHS
jgi:hypothetical protein